MAFNGLRNKIEKMGRNSLWGSTFVFGCFLYLHYRFPCHSRDGDHNGSEFEIEEVIVTGEQPPLLLEAMEYAKKKKTCKECGKVAGN